MSIIGQKLLELVKRPVRLATAPSAQRAYINTFLFISTSLALLCIAAIAYPVFYYTYVPKKVVSLPIHLQYNAGLNPYGLASLSHDLMLDTAYDVTVQLTLPRSPPNLDHGNFMVALVATRSVLENPAQSWLAPPPDPYAEILDAPADHVVFSSRRPALLPYEDPLVSGASRALFLFWHVLMGAVSRSSAARITIDLPMGELVEFREHLPLSLLLDVQAGQSLQVYAARVELVARLTGVRWLMYNHRLLSFVLCTVLFWSAEMVSMAAAWALLLFFFNGSAGAGAGLVGPHKPHDGAAAGPGDESAEPVQPSGQPTPTKGYGGGRAVAVASGKPATEHERQLAIKLEEEEEERRWAERERDGSGAATDLGRARAEKRPAVLRLIRSLADGGDDNDRKIKEESVERGRPLSSTTASFSGSPRPRHRGGANGDGDDVYDEDDEEYQDIGGNGAAAGTGSSYGQGSAQGLVRRRSSASSASTHVQRKS